LKVSSRCSRLAFSILQGKIAIFNEIIPFFRTFLDKSHILEDLPHYGPACEALAGGIDRARQQWQKEWD
jgi:hypothetical protein